MKAVSSPEVSKTSGQWDISFGKLSGIAILCFLLLTVTWIALDVGSIWVSAMLVAHAPEFVRSLKLWGKFFILQVVFGFLGGMLGGAFGAMAGNSQNAAGVGAFIGVILGLIRIAVTLFIIPGHFDISFFRSVAFLLTYLVAFGISLAVTAGCLVLLMMFEPIGEAVLVHAWLRPLGLV